MCLYFIDLTSLEPFAEILKKPFRLLFGDLKPRKIASDIIGPFHKSRH